jgi:hypothetical protein
VPVGYPNYNLAVQPSAGALWEEDMLDVLVFALFLLGVIGFLWFVQRNLRRD